MKIIVHGTIGGYKVFYKSENTPFSIARDARSASGKTDPLGQLAYSFIFDGRGCAFTKYIIVYDVQRGAIGFMAFTLYIANTEKLSGKYIKQFLDELTQQYSDIYIVDNRVDSIRVCRDWTFVEKLRSEYINQLEIISKEDIEIIEQGAAENAFIYYSSEDELIKYLDSPYEKEYEKYKQIFLVNEELKGKAINPLNSLSHNPENDLTGKIDIDNPKYRLIFNSHTKDGVSILAEENINGIWVKRNNNNKVRKNDIIKITHKKSYYISDSAEGILGAFDSSFIDIDDEKKTVIIKDKKLLPEERIITFELNKKHLEDIEISVIRKNSYQKYSPKKVDNNQVKFTAEEIGGKWTVSAKTKGGDFIAEDLSFIPKDINEIITLEFEEHKIIKVRANDKGNGDFINDIVIRFSRELKTPSKGDEITFIGEEINRPCEINVSDLNRQYNSTTYNFTPKDIDKIVNVDLIRKKIPSPKDPENDVKIYGGESTLLSNEKKTWYRTPKVIAGSVFMLAIVAVFFAFVLISNKDNKDFKKNSLESEVIEYCQGVELKIDKLENYLSQLDSLKKKENRWYNYILGTSFFISETVNSINKTSDTLKQTIKFRKTINKGEIRKLSGMIHNLSDDQQGFKNAIKNAKEVYYVEIGESMKTTVSTMNLNEIGIYINELHDILEIGNIEEVSDKAELEKKKEELQEKRAKDSSSNLATIIDSRIKDIDNKLVEIGDSTPSTTDDTSKGLNEMSNLTQDESGNGINNEGNQSSEFVTKFWNLVNSGNNTKDDFVDLYNKFYSGKSFRDGTDESKIKKYLHSITLGTNEFGEFKSIPEIRRKNAKKLEDLKK